jgi:hypothetical protein
VTQLGFDRDTVAMSQLDGLPGERDVLIERQQRRIDHDPGET